jgi:hypothetical protein
MPTNESAIRYFSDVLASGYVYPCSLDDIRQALASLPEGDLLGLHSVGLTMPVRPHRNANAVYFNEPVPRIAVCAYPDSLEIPMPRRLTLVAATRAFADELRHGMKLERREGRVFAVWNAKNLRGFILGHVLPHEVGHHVFRHILRRRLQPGWRDAAESEKFAEHYARRWGKLVS